MDGNAIQVAILIPPGLQASLERGEQVAVQVVVDGVDSKTASVASGYAAQVFGDFNQRRIEATGLDARRSRHRCPRACACSTPHCEA